MGVFFYFYLQKHIILIMNEGFNQEDYTMPEDSVRNISNEKEGALSKSEENIEQSEVENTESSIDTRNQTTPEKSVTEKMEDELEREKIYLDNIDKISHSTDFKSDTEYTEKLKEIASKIENEDLENTIQNKIYFEKIKNLINSHINALDKVAKTIEPLGPESYSFKKGLEEKSNELSQRKTILERHLYDLTNYIKEDN